MRRITVLVASALIHASTIPGLAAESTLNKDVNPALAVSATVHGKAANAADNEKTCRAYACVCRKLKPERSGDEVRPRGRLNL